MEKSVENSNAVLKFINSFLDIVFPNKCVGCQKIGEILCAGCSETLVEYPEKRGGLIAVFKYKDARIRKLIWELKYRGARTRADILAKCLYDRVLEDLSEKHIFNGLSPEEKLLLVPVPADIRRARERGCDHTKLIAQKIVKQDRGNFISLETSILKKVESTKSQVELKDKAKRQNNLKNCFAISNKELLKNKVVILFDDVYTTGTTMKECSNILLEAGARKIIPLVIAR